MSEATVPAVKAPILTRDFAFFFEGLKARTLLVQKCDSCGRRRHPASPMCPHCQSLKWTAVALPTTGCVHSYVVHYYPPLADYGSPHPIVLVDMDAEIRVVGSLAGCEIQDIHVGMPVKTEFVDHGSGFVLHRFRPAEG